MKRLSVRARRVIETSTVVAAAGLLTLIGALPAHASPGGQPSTGAGSPTRGYAPWATMPILVPTGGIKTPVHAAASSSVSIMNDPAAPSGFSFSPASVSVHVGDSVTWTNNSTGGVPHSTTSDSPGWDSGFMNPGQQFSHTFPTVGTFSYHCKVHPTMLGTVVVQASTTTTTSSSTTSTTVKATTSNTGAGSTTTSTVATHVQGSTTATTAALATTGSEAAHLVKIALATLLAGFAIFVAASRRRVQD